MPHHILLGRCYDLIPRCGRVALRTSLGGEDNKYIGRHGWTLWNSSRGFVVDPSYLDWILRIILDLWRILASRPAANIDRIQ